MGSSSPRTNDVDTTNVALDRSLTNGEGTAILDSIIISSSDVVQLESLQTHRENFAALMASGSGTISSFVGLMENLISDIESGRLDMADAQFQDLENARDFMLAQSEQGVLVFELSAELARDSIDFAGDVASDNSSLSERALELVSDVKTSEASSIIASTIMLMTVFGLGAIYMTKKG